MMKERPDPHWEFAVCCVQLGDSFVSVKTDSR